jgi:regulator of protease activity HflC (stomatin/prohibitin superfamily)
VFQGQGPVARRGPRAVRSADARDTFDVLDTVSQLHKEGEEEMLGWLVLGFFLFVLLILFFAGIRIAQEYQRGVVFRLGRFKTVKGPGFYTINPILERSRTIDIRTRTVDIEPQEAITKDSVTIRVNAVLYYKITNPKKAVIEVTNFKKAINQASLTTLRNIIGQNELDDLLKERDRINGTLREIIDELSDPWGIEVEMVEMKAVEIPSGMQRAMAREAEAMREKRARLIKADAEMMASKKLSVAAKEIDLNPSALELRRLQMISEVGAEQNTTTIILIPSDFVHLARNVSKFLEAGSEGGG